MNWKLIVPVAMAGMLAACGGSTSRNTPIVVFPDMDFQHRYDPQTERPFFADGRGSRTPVPGTVAIGALHENEPFYTGRQAGNYIGRIPVPITEDLLLTGRRRFNTYCSPCHDRTGQGRGVVATRAIWVPTSLHDDRVRQFNDGEIFNVITHGRRSMPSYRYQIAEADRWAIVAYVRALQRTRMGTISDVPADQQAGLR